MDRNAVLRWVVIAAAIILFWKFGMPLFTGKGGEHGQNVPAETYTNAPGFVPDVIDPETGNQPNLPPEGEICKIKGNRYNAELSTRGAAITHLYLRDAQYAGANGFDMSSTPDIERWRSLRTTFRDGDAKDQVAYDRFNWKLERMPDEKGCTFTYADDAVKIVKTISAGTRPFELNVDTTVTNLTPAPKKHQLALGLFAFRRNSEVKGNLGRVSPFLTELSCAKDKDVTRKSKDDFKEGWLTASGIDRYVAVNNYYFTEALIPVPDSTETGAEPPGTPECKLLAEEWVTAGQAKDDDNAGAVYHANLVYPTHELAPQHSAEYKQIAFFGPKERDVLAAAAAGRPGLGDTINLGFFSPVAKVLVTILNFFHDKITGSWGLAIIAMTLCLRTLLFPLQLKQIRTSIGMRKLKPEVDLINKKFAADAQAKNLAMMELWKKHGINPLGGCLPQLVQMPIWFAMYTTLQTSVEMYHTKFLWFTDLSAPDRFYILPLVLGAFMIVQQRIVPQQGMDPMQQKMMTWLLPGVFTVMMLFLPAALGVYMLTNSALGILQQLVVEQVAPRNGGGTPTDRIRGEITVKQVDSNDAKRVSAFGKGKARV